MVRFTSAFCSICKIRGCGGLHWFQPVPHSLLLGVCDLPTYCISQIGFRWLKKNKNLNFPEYHRCSWQQLPLFDSCWKKMSVGELGTSPKVWDLLIWNCEEGESFLSKKWLVFSHGVEKKKEVLLELSFTQLSSIWLPDFSSLFKWAEGKRTITPAFSSWE